MAATFEKCYLFGEKIPPTTGTYVDLSKWNVGNVRTLEVTFQAAKAFRSDVSKWDVSNVNNLKNTFNKATNWNSDLSQWNGK